MESKTTQSKPARLYHVWQRKKARSKLFWPALGVAAVTIVLDQLTKLWILHGLKLQDMTTLDETTGYIVPRLELSKIFDLTFVQNKGVSFGLFAGGLASRVILSTLSIAVTIGLIYWLAKIRRKAAAFGVGFIIGGALGNTIDRIAYGWVVDFLDFSGLHFPYVFNVADMAVNLGVGLLIYDAFFGQKSALQAVSHTNF